MPYDNAYTEDACLNRCLLAKFANVHNCTHARLKHLLATPPSLPFCTFDSFNHNDNNNNTEANATDPGLETIHSLLEGFSADEEEADVKERRCGCPKPCVKSHLKVQTWKTQPADIHGLKKTVFAFLQVRFLASPTSETAA